MNALLEVSGLGVSYGDIQAVGRLDLTIGARETVALVGESGCGKSTSALALMGLLPAGAEVKGRADFDGHDLLSLDGPEMRRLRGKSIAMVFQDSMTALNPVLTVGRQIVESIELHSSLSGKAAYNRAVELLRLVGVRDAHERQHQFPHQFSGGQRQRVAIAMAVAGDPKLLIADEPTTALDAAIQVQVLKLLDRLRGELGMSLLLITHDLGLVRRWADRVAIMRRGEVIEAGEPDHIFSRPEQTYTKVLIGAALSPDDKRHYTTARLPETRDADAAPAAVVPFPTPRQAPERTEKRDGGAAQPLLSVVDLQAHYLKRRERVKVLDGVTFDIAPGETLGLVGESGCGKSTLSRVIMRLQPASAGSIRFEGSEIGRLSEGAFRPYRPRMQMVFQDPHASLNPRHRVIDTMDWTLRVNGVASSTERARRILDIADRVGLQTKALERYPHELSGGQKQRVGVARALLLRPALLICDEPASSLDLPVRSQVLNLLSDLKAEFGLSYLFISHDLSIVRYMADRVAVMQAGRIVEIGDRRQIWERPAHPYTLRLIASASDSTGRRDALVQDTLEAADVEFEGPESGVRSAL
jgi:peptide/nickel transport system ATP-binding protein